MRITRLSSSIALVTLASLATLATACSSAKSRSGFEQEPAANEPAAGFGDNGGFSGPDAKPVECAKAEAEAVRPPIDVIVSVDQSGSMSDDIANVKANINQLSAFLQKTGLDYRVVMIGTVGTGAYDLCVPPPLGGASCASNGNTFRTVNRNVQSNDTLDIIVSTLGQTTGPTAWRDFLRPDSMKVFIPITDDDSYYLTASSFDQQLLAVPGGLFGVQGARKYVFYPITGAAAFPSESTCGSNAVNSGKVYLDLAKRTGGKWFPICSTNFAPVFEEIGRNVASTVACELAIPKPGDDTEIDLGRVNVKVATPGGATTDILQDSTHECADGANGWQYNASKTKILLCGDACKAASGNTGTKVTVEFGCETKVK
jgi:hypothetical protein